MTRKQIGAILGAVVLAVAAPLLALVLLHALDGDVQASSIVTVGIDMDPSATPANDHSTVGSVELCIQTTAGASIVFDL